MVKSKLPDAILPEMPLHQLIFANVDQHANKTAFVDSASGKQYTYRETKAISDNVSAVLQQRGVRKGDVIAIILHNCPEFGFFLYGAMAVGAVTTLANPNYTIYELTNQVKDSGATVILTSAEHASKMKQLAVNTNQVKEIFVVGYAAGCTPFQEFINYKGRPFDPSVISFNTKEDVVFLPYSSGTTGVPKGVQLTHYNIVSNVQQVNHQELKDPDEDPTEQARSLAVLPFFHAMSLNSVLVRRVAAGSMIITMPRFKPEPFLQNIEKYKIRNLVLVPPLAVFLVKSHLTEKYDLSSLKMFYFGAAPLSKETERQLFEKFGVRNQQGYGLTETSPAAITVPYSKLKPGSIGIIVSNTEVQVVDVDTGKVLGPNQPGEIWLRGPQVMIGYHNKPEDTRKAIDEQGWLHTGDIGYYDEDEYFFIVDRIKELIKYKGMQVAPAELEALLLTHPEVADAAVTSVDDEEAGELPMAYIVRKPGSTPQETDIIKFISERVAPHKQLRGGVEFMDNIPKTETGKILRRQLKDQASKRKLNSRL